MKRDEERGRERDEERWRERERENEDGVGWDEIRRDRCVCVCVRTWLLSISPEQKYSAGIMHRVDMMRSSLLKYGSVAGNNEEVKK